jgi:glycerol dehydrogenase-like iron-containing ADH family enzyme
VRNTFRVTIHYEPFEVTPETVADAILAAHTTSRAWKRSLG